MTDEKLKSLLAFFDEEKKYYVDGYYRLRKLETDKFELAYLIPDACGATTVHPQITIEKHEDIWTPTKLIDMWTSPTQFVERNSETEKFLNEALHRLAFRFENVMVKSI